VLSTIDLVEFEVLRITSAPSCRKALAVAPTSSAPRSRIILSLSGECETAMVSKPAPVAYCIQATLYTTIAVAKTTAEHPEQRTKIGGLGWGFLPCKRETSD
jgi:hypothetical protein